MEGMATVWPVPEAKLGELSPGLDMSGWECQVCVLYGHFDDPSGGVEIQKLNIGVLVGCHWRISVHGHQVLGKPLGDIHLEDQWKVCPLAIVVDSVPVRGTNFQPCLFACCPPHPSWQCPQLPSGFPCPGHYKGPEEHGLGLVMLE